MTTATAERPSVATVFADTMGHDLMAFILSTLRTMPDHWARMSQEQQEKRIAEMRESVTAIVQKCAQIVAGQGFQAVGCALDGVAIKDEVKIALIMKPGDPARHALYDAKGRDVLLVLASTEQWLEKMDEIKSDKGQLDMLESDATNCNPARDQPAYRRDQDRTAPLGMSWEQLKKNLNEAFPKAASKEDGVTGAPPADEPKPNDLAELRGVVIIWPTGQREPLASYKFEVEPGETLVQALERAFPGCQFVTLPADPLDRLGIDITGPLGGVIQMRRPANQENVEPEPWGTYDAEEGQPIDVADDETVRQALEKLYPGFEFRFVPDEQKDTSAAESGTQPAESGTGEPEKDIPPATDKEGQAIVYESGPLPAGADPEAAQLLEQLVAIGMSINLESVKRLMPEQRALVRTWLGDWTDAFERGVALEDLPQRPFCLPLFTPPHRQPKPEAGGKRKRGGKST